MSVYKEIGSEFWDIPICKVENNLFPSNTQWFRSGRDAIGFVIDDIQCRQAFRSVAIPSWCCESMIVPFISRGITVRFYSVAPSKNGGIIQNISEASGCDGILLLDYFGYIEKTYDDGFNGIEIYDITHSIFSDISYCSGYVLGSLRKWAGFMTGGFAYKCHGDFIQTPLPEDKNYSDLRKLAMDEKCSYIFGEKKEKTYLHHFVNANKMLKPIGLGGSPVDTKLAKKLDIEYIKKRRRQNAKVLMDRLSDFALFHCIREGDCPLFVPILVPEGKRDELKKHLAAQSIYCPSHWPASPNHNLNVSTRRLYDEELSIVCDQRYDIKDMEKISDEILSYLK